MIDHLAVTSLQLLNNIISIRNSLLDLHRYDICAYIDKLLPDQSAEVLHHVESVEEWWEFIGDLVIIISRIYHRTPPESHSYIFRNYQKALEFAPGQGYAPKTEVQSFCRYIEPHIIIRINSTQESREKSDAYTSGYYRTT